MWLLSMPVVAFLSGTGADYPFPDSLAFDEGEHASRAAYRRAGRSGGCVGPLEEAAADRLGDFLGQQEEFLFVGLQRRSELGDEFFAWEFAKVEFAVLDLSRCRRRRRRHARPVTAGSGCEPCATHGCECISPPP